MSASKNKNVSREADERSRLGRDVEALPSMELYHRTMSNINPDVIPPGMVWGWLAYEVQGESQRSQLETQYRGGWRPIKRGAYSQLTLGDDLERYLPQSSNAMANDCILDRGRILCEIPQEAYDRNQKESDFRNKEQMDRIKLGQHGNNDQSGAYIGQKADMAQSGVSLTAPSMHQDVISTNNRSFGR